MSAERATFDSSYQSNNILTKETMRGCLSEEQFSEWESLKQHYRHHVRMWRKNIANNKQRLNTMKREDMLVSLARRLQEFGEVVEERNAESRRQHEAQDAEARAQAEVINRLEQSEP